jgi:hypothetical protein
MDCRKTMNPIENKLNFYVSLSPSLSLFPFIFSLLEALKFKGKSDDGLEKKRLSVPSKCHQLSMVIKMDLR